MSQSKIYLIAILILLGLSFYFLKGHVFSVYSQDLILESQFVDFDVGIKNLNGSVYKDVTVNQNCGGSFTGYTVKARFYINEVSAQSRIVSSIIGDFRFGPCLGNPPRQAYPFNLDVSGYSLGKYELVAVLVASPGYSCASGCDLILKSQESRFEEIFNKIETSEYSFGVYNDGYGSTVYRQQFAVCEGKICSYEVSPCELRQGEMIVFDRFGAGVNINSLTLTYNPERFCSNLLPVEINELTLQTRLNSQPLIDLQKGLTYVVPENTATGIYYIAVKPTSLYVVCKIGESYVAKEGICVGTTGIATPCVNGILNPDGTCFVQPNINLICPGQLQVLSDGTQVCNIIVPVREIYTCIRSDGTSYVVNNPVDCLINLNEKYYCNGVEVATVNDCRRDLEVRYICKDPNTGDREVALQQDCSYNFVPTYYCTVNGVRIKVDNKEDCSELLEKKYYCDGLLIANPNDCIQYLDIDIYCKRVDGTTYKVLSVTDCKIEETVQQKYYCQLSDGTRYEVNSGNECINNINLETTYYCAGIKVNSPDDCRRSLEIQYYCNDVKVSSDYNCRENIATKYYCDGNLVDSPSKCESFLSIVLTCFDSYTDKSWTVKKPEDCNQNIELSLQCGDKIVQSIDECKKEIEAEIVIKCSEGIYDKNIGKCVVRIEAFFSKYLWGILIVIGLLVIFVILFIGRKK